MGIQERFGIRLRTLRERQGFTQAQLGKRARLSQEYVARLETGTKANPSLDVLLRLAKALAVKPGKLLK
jgi:transcriptional regulator with XRE-family HTH domain